MPILYVVWPEGSLDSQAAKHLDPKYGFSFEYKRSVQEIFNALLIGNYALVPIHSAASGTNQETFKAFETYPNIFYVFHFVRLRIDGSLSKDISEKNISTFGVFANWEYTKKFL